MHLVWLRKQINRWTRKLSINLRISINWCGIFSLDNYILKMNHALQQNIPTNTLFTPPLSLLSNSDKIKKSGIMLKRESLRLGSVFAHLYARILLVWALTSFPHRANPDDSWAKGTATQSSQSFCFVFWNWSVLKNFFFRLIILLPNQIISS